MTFIAGILTVLILLNCVLLIFLVLVQLPKKDAGAGLAFGGGAADALFGAGSGNALTKITKYATAVFVALALCLGLTVEHLHRNDVSTFKKALEQKQSQLSTPTPPAQPAPAPAATPMPLTTTPANVPEKPAATPTAPAPAAAGTNAPVK